MSERNQIPEWNGWKLENGEFLNYSKEVSRIAHGFDAAKCRSLFRQITAKNVDK